MQVGDTNVSGTLIRQKMVHPTNDNEKNLSLYVMSKKNANISLLLP